MVTFYLVKTYRIPSVSHGCEIRCLYCSDCQRLNVIWNNSFRRIFGCCWHENVACLQIYCQTLPLSYMVNQRTTSFLKTALNCDIRLHVLLQTFICTTSGMSSWLVKRSVYLILLHKLPSYLT